MKKILSFFIKWCLIFLFSSVAVFIAVRLMPTTPMEKWLEAYHLPDTEENINYLTAKMGLDKPLIVQYMLWIGGFLRGDWGVSIVSQEDIMERFLAKMPYSFSIGALGIMLGAVGAFILGYCSAVRLGGFCDKFSTFLTIFSQSVPNFIVSILIIYAFSVKLKIAKFFTGSGKYAMTAAILLTALYCAGNLSRVVRTAFREEMQKSYVKFAIIRGFKKESFLLKHAYRNAMASLISAVISRFAGVFGGSTVLEFAFAIPGISTLLVSSMDSRDYNVLQTYVLVVILWMFFVHLVLNTVLSLLHVRGEQ